MGTRRRTGGRAYGNETAGVEMCRVGQASAGVGLGWEMMAKAYHGARPLLVAGDRLGTEAVQIATTGATASTECRLAKQTERELRLHRTRSRDC